ncbi:winged helix-turn-helix transcriptional regulator, partial [Escherichia coli]|nr:winged helix-turn-helix transcriptional regulator [Escherichia coli]
MAKQAPAAKPGVRGSRTGRPIMALLDLLGRRWTLRILWELRDGALTSRALRTACDEASPTILQTRLTELREA